MDVIDLLSIIPSGELYRAGYFLIQDSFKGISFYYIWCAVRHVSFQLQVEEVFA